MSPVCELEPLLTSLRLQKFQYSKSKSGTQPGDLGIYLDFLNNMLNNFSPWETQEKSEFYYTKLYRLIKELSSIDINQTIKFVSRGEHLTCL